MPHDGCVSPIWKFVGVSGRLVLFDLDERFVAGFLGDRQGLVWAVERVEGKQTTR